MVEAEPPTVTEQYGGLIYLTVCVIVASTLIYPLLTNRWDVNNSENEWKFVAVYVVYGLICLAIFVFLVQPIFGIPNLNLDDFNNVRFHVGGFFTALYAQFKLA